MSGRDGKRVEVQIRTRQMHEVAEAGVAAHWAYRDGVRTKNPFAVDPGAWIDTLTDRFEGEDHNEFLEHVKLEMYQDQVFCFSPKGDVLQLPKGATPIDFAYAIHTRLGNSCVGAKVDGIRVPLWTRLKNGQSVDIISASGQRPQTTWLDIVVTGRAKAAIRRSLREEDRDRFIRLGRELVRVSFEHVGRKVTDKALATAARQMGLQDIDELLSRIGSAENSAQEVIRILYPDLDQKHADIDVQRPFAGLEADAEFQRAPCCNPLPGERIVGITYRGKGLVIHAIDCPVLAEFEDSPDRWIDLKWREGRHPAAYSALLQLTIRHDAGVLGRICSLIGGQGANISNLEFIERKPDFYRIEVEVELRDYEHLHNLLTALEAENDVAQVARIRDPALKP